MIFFRNALYYIKALSQVKANVKLHDIIVFKLFYTVFL